MKTELVEGESGSKVEVDVDKDLVQEPLESSNEQISVSLRDSYSVKLDDQEIEVKVPRRTKEITGAELKEKLGVYEGDNLFLKQGTKWKKVSDGQEFDLREDLNFNTGNSPKTKESTEPSFSSIQKALAD